MNGARVVSFSVVIGRAGRALLAGAMLAALSGPARAADKTAEPAGKAPAAAAAQPARVVEPTAPGSTFPVSKFIVSYWRENPSLPSLAAVRSLEVSLAKTAAGYAAPKRGEPTVKVRLDQEFAPAAVFTASAIQRINQAIVAHYDRLGLLCVSAAPAEDDIDPSSLEDRRPAKNNQLRLVIWTGTVSQIRTLATGDRVPAESRINNPVHRRIVEGSPIQAGRPMATSRPGGSVSRPAEGAQPVAPVAGGLVMKEPLDDYVAFLNRHPGRRVDASVSSVGKPGEVSLDYLVAESKPWVAYAQVANTGTKNTGEWRERFGLVHNQLTGNDDVFSVDYSTIGFDTTHSVALSYEAPVFKMDRLRWRLYGNWGSYTASDIGIAHMQFTGEDMSLGAELIANIFQHKQLFVDLIGGFAFRRVEVVNKLFDTYGDEEFFLPHVGIRAERTTERDSVWAQIMLEGFPGGADREKLDNLGRLKTSGHWGVMKWDSGMSFYLENLCNAAHGTKAQTLAHEIYAQFRGQWAGGYRLIPQAEEIAGGFYTVRGYPESATAGDTLLLGTTEYRFHIPRALKINRDPGKTPVFGRPFRFSPQEEFGQADWDLIARSFLDIGRTVSTGDMPGETDDTLVGWGVGLELLIKRNVSVRADWGMALKDVESANVEAGDNRFHLVFTFLW